MQCTGTLTLNFFCSISGFSERKRCIRVLADIITSTQKTTTERIRNKYRTAESWTNRKVTQTVSIDSPLTHFLKLRLPPISPMQDPALTQGQIFISNQFPFLSSQFPHCNYPQLFSLLGICTPNTEKFRHTENYTSQFIQKKSIIIIKATTMEKQMTEEKKWSRSHIQGIDLLLFLWVLYWTRSWSRSSVMANGHLAVISFIALILKNGKWNMFWTLWLAPTGPLRGWIIWNSKSLIQHLHNFQFTREEHHKVLSML